MTDLQPSNRVCPSAQARRDVAEWYYPVVARDNAQLDRWCTVVGPPILDSIPSAPLGLPGAGEPLTVAVWNTDAGAGDVVAFLRTEMGLQCSGSASIRSTGAPHFVLLLQEALRRSPQLDAVAESWATPPPVAEEDRPGQRLGVYEVARHCGLAVFYAPAARNGHEKRDGNGEDKGIAILSTLPLSDPIILELPFESARRVVLGATVHDGAGDSLRLLSVHLITTPQAWRVITTANSSRTRQAMAIVRALDQIERKRAPTGSAAPLNSHPISTILAGDFNTWSQSESALQHLLEYFPDSPRPLMRDTRGPFPTDHILFRQASTGNQSFGVLQSGSYRRIANRYYSDHHPIVVQFLLQ